MIIQIDKSLYSREAVTATIYRFSADYDISVESMGESNKYALSINRIDRKNVDPSVELFFIRELTDQQVRLDIEARFGHIRDLIVEEAFKPISKG